MHLAMDLRHDLEEIFQMLTLWVQVSELVDQKVQETNLFE